MSLLKYVRDKVGQAKTRVLAVPKNYREAYDSGKQIGERVKRGLVSEGVDLNLRDETLRNLRMGIRSDGLPVEVTLGCWFGMTDAWFRYYGKAKK